MGAPARLARMSALAPLRRADQDREGLIMNPFRTLPDAPAGAFAGAVFWAFHPDQSRHSARVAGSALFD
jgi:hypothetical protein